MPDKDIHPFHQYESPDSIAAPDIDAEPSTDPTSALSGAETVPDARSNGQSRRRSIKADGTSKVTVGERVEPVRYDATIKERPSDERPRERLEKMGASAL